MRPHRGSFQLIVSAVVLALPAALAAQEKRPMSFVDGIELPVI